MSVETVLQGSPVMESNKRKMKEINIKWKQMKSCKRIK